MNSYYENIRESFENEDNYIIPPSNTPNESEDSLFDNIIEVIRAFEPEETTPLLTNRNNNVYNYTNDNRNDIRSDIRNDIRRYRNNRNRSLRRFRPDFVIDLPEIDIISNQNPHLNNVIGAYNPHINSREILRRYYEIQNKQNNKQEILDKNGNIIKESNLFYIDR